MKHDTDGIFSRTAMLLGQTAQASLEQKHVVILGLGGVGGHCAEALARCGVGNMLIIDGDVISISNLNRQIVSNKFNIGRSKALEMAKRIESISNCNVVSKNIFIHPDMIDGLIPENTDYIIDAVDDVSVKAAVVQHAKNAGLNIISSMGMGNRLDPTMVRVGDIFSIEGCPLARVMRRELRKRNIESLMTAYSLEPAAKPLITTPSGRSRPVPGSSPFVPAAAGLAMAHYAVIAMLNATPR